MNFKKLLPLITIVLVLAACSKKPDVEYTSTYKMAGEWFVTYYDNTAPNTAVSTVQHIYTYNTSDPNSGQIWVDDHNNTTAAWRFKSKFDIDLPSLTFKPVAAAVNTVAAGRTIKVTEGKIIESAAHSKSGNVVDSIYFQIQFSNVTPARTFNVRGHRRTGFFEDEY